YAGRGPMAQGHRPDEFVHADQLAQCDAMLDALLERLAAGI
ncbi:MAG: acetylornithine deacetylase, partial [Sulfitobacter sp. SK025]